LRLRVWCISGSRALSTFFVELGALMRVASTMVPVPTFMPWVCSTAPTLANSASPSECFSSRRLNSSKVVASGTRSRPRSMPTKRRSEGLSSKASSHAWSPRLNPCCTKYMRNMRCSPTCGRPLAGLGVVRLDDAAQRRPRNDLLHRRQKSIAPGRLAIPLVLRVVIGGHGKGLLLHVGINAGGVPGGGSVSVALDIFAPGCWKSSALTLRPFRSSHVTHQAFVRQESAKLASKHREATLEVSAKRRNPKRLGRCGSPTAVRFLSASTTCLKS